MTNVLIIRPNREGIRISTLLKEKNINVSIYPLFEPMYLNLNLQELPQAFIITSKNALYAIKERKDLKETPLYIVGSQTAVLARKMGFSKVLKGAMTSNELLHCILKTSNPNKGPFLHLSGEYVTGNMVETLTQNGFEAKRYIIYNIKDADEFPKPLLVDLLNNKITHVMLFSPRTTSVFINLLQKKNLEPSISRMISLCLSKNVAEKASILMWERIWISPKPNVKSIIGYFDEK